MTIIRRSAAWAGLGLSIIGLLLCLTCAAGVWVVKSRVDRVTIAAFDAADDAFEFMAMRLVLVQQRIDSSRGQVDALAKRAERLQTLEAELEVRAEAESFRETLDMVVSELKAAEVWLDSIEAVARGVQSAAESIADAKVPTAMENAETGGVRAARVAEMAEVLADAINRLDGLRREVLELRENRVLARELATAMIKEAAQLDTRLTDLHERMDDLGTHVSEVRKATADTRHRVLRWIVLTAATLMVLSLWFVLSQVCMLKRTWQMTRE